jgi:hypothetical protein
MAAVAQQYRDEEINEEQGENMEVSWLATTAFLRGGGVIFIVSLFPFFAA